MDKIKVGIIGFGAQSAARTFHVPLISHEPLMEIKLVSSLTVDEIRPLLPGITLTSEASDIINDPEIDLVVIATPNALHFNFAKQALEAGKHVVVEKPFALTVKEADELIELAKKQGRILTQFHNRRWDGGFLTVQKLKNKGRFGDIVTYEANYDRWVPNVPDNWREKKQPGSGALFDLGVHLIDQALALFGRPKTVYATILTQRDNATADDYFHLQLNYGDELQVILHATMLGAIPGPRYKVTGKKGTYVKKMADYGSDPQADMLNKGMSPSDLKWGLDKEKDYGVFSDGSTEERIPTVPGAYKSFYNGVAAAITNGSPLPVPIEDARDILAIIEAASLSSKEVRCIPAEEIGFLTT